MENLIELELIKILEDACKINVQTHKIKNISDHLEDWDDIEDYPAIIVVCSDWFESGVEFQGTLKDYTAYIFVLIYGETIEEARHIREVISKRILECVRKNPSLNNLVDPETRENVYGSRCVSGTFSEGGFEEGYTVIQRIITTVQCEQIYT